MDLRELGFDSWFQQQWQTVGEAGRRPARITAVNKDRYLIRNEMAEIIAEPTGRLVFTATSPSDLPCVGDWVSVQYHNDDSFAIIHSVLPRRTSLQRKTPGREIDVQMIASNIDTVFVVQSCNADFNIRRLERYLVMVHEGQIEPVLLLSKSDLVSPEELDQIVTLVREEHIAADAIPYSSITGDGYDNVLNALLPGRTYCMLGSSGVGKTTLLNRLLGKEVFETNPIREKDGRGRHTTSRRQLTMLENGALLIDTPGMRELGMIDVEGGIDESFSDISAFISQCKFSDCSHTTEKGCAVLAAIESGELSEERFESYKKLLRESAYHQMSYVDRRKKDKAFGKKVKAILKHKNKRKGL
jgi:ribosome biogenesis GTPase